MRLRPRKSSSPGLRHLLQIRAPDAQSALRKARTCLPCSLRLVCRRELGKSVRAVAAGAAEKNHPQRRRLESLSDLLVRRGRVEISNPHHKMPLCHLCLPLRRGQGSRRGHGRGWLRQGCGGGWCRPCGGRDNRRLFFGRENQKSGRSCHLFKTERPRTEGAVEVQNSAVGVDDSSSLMEGVVRVEEACSKFDSS